LPRVFPGGLETRKLRPNDINDRLMKEQLTAPPVGGNILGERSLHAPNEIEYIDSNRDGFGAAQDDSFSVSLACV